MSHLLTVFRVSEDGHSNVDVAILHALLKGRALIFTMMALPDWVSCKRTSQH